MFPFASTFALAPFCPVLALVLLIISGPRAAFTARERRRAVSGIARPTRVCMCRRGSWTWRVPVAA